MRGALVLALAVGCCICVSLPAQEQRQVRRSVSLPADVKAVFLAQMLGHVVALDGVVTALGHGDFRRAAEIAESEMGVPRGSMPVSSEGPGLGLGKHLPEEMREIGGRFHAAAREFASLARSLPATPSTQQHQALLAALSRVTNECRACHDRFRID